MPDRVLVGLIPRPPHPERARPSRLLLAAVLLAACGQPVATPVPVHLDAAGSTSLAPLVAELAEAFSQKFPVVGLNVERTGTQFGLEMLHAGKVELALVSWLPDGPGDGWQALTIARDGIAIIVHPSNPIRGLGLLQLQDLFSGQIYEWQGVGGRPEQGVVQPVSREEGSGTRDAFETLAMEGKAVTPRAVVVPSSQVMIDYVARHPGAIGYVSSALVSPAVRVVKIEGEAPSPEAIRQGSYPLSRELWMVTARSPGAAVRQFLEFCLGPAGQQIVGRRYTTIR